MKDSTTSSSVESSTSLLNLVITLYWKAFGNLPILFIPLIMIKEKDPALSGRDIVFAAAVVALIVMRVVDARFYEAAKPGEVKKYIVGVMVVSTVLFVLGHGLAKLFA